jgi:acetyl-CoA carboxylase biotin carboxyl carrier protein
MANGRKTQKSATATATNRKQWPAEDESGGSGSGSQEDLVTIVRGLAAAVAEHNLSELVVDTPEVTFTLRRGIASVQTVAMPAPMGMPMGSMPMSMPMAPMPTASLPQQSHAAALAAAAPAYTEPPAAEDKSHVVTSPFVGTFYRRPNPDSPTYVNVNDKVKRGQVLCIVEAMKLMNEIEADIDGTIVGILAEDQSPVEYGQPLFKIAP